MKKANQRGLHTGGFHLYDIQEKAENCLNKAYGCQRFYAGREVGGERLVRDD